MSKIFKASVYEHEALPWSRAYFTGEIDGVFLNTNIPELQQEPCVFVSDTKAELLASMISYLKGKGKSGVLRVVN